jgi:hypothetical protein
MSFFFRVQEYQMSQQNPIHRDGGRRDGVQPFRDNKEAMNEQQAEIERAAPLPEDQAENLTEEERDELRRQSASERLAEVDEEIKNEDASS